ncbi:sperm-associated antigen 8-like [Pomacea canaliculata]|nr:sperm-associated antigen 8-like [Pomacea canaliculata]
MSVLSDGRNEIPVGNSNAKCLLENWVEERAVKDIDPDVKIGGEVTSLAKELRHGHRGVLSADFNARCENKTIHRISYTPPEITSVRQTGRRKELMRRMLFAQICEEKKVGPEPEPEPTDFRSVKMVDYDFEFESKPPAPTRDHNYRTEQPVTFWTEHKDKLHGVTQIKTRDTVFRRNDAFTKPIEEYWNEPKPYELEDYPKM